MPVEPATSEHARSRPLARVLRGLERVELSLGVFLVAFILVLVMMQVLARFTPIPSEVWTGELAKFSLIWLAFGLAGYLMGRDEHIALDVVDNVLPRIGRIVVRVFSLLVVAATSLSFAYEGWTLVTSDSPIKSPAAGIPMTWVYVIPTIGMVLTGVRALMLIVVRPTGHTVRVAGEPLAESLAEGTKP
ncbi:TRAP transporter small permease [Mumia sp. Pv 4-285]|uniref:TRAP transporter small permease n=1 Tax=Mumia qirimensis TaxID=3234852 RepID=UPI00351D9660